MTYGLPKDYENVLVKKDYILKKIWATVEGRKLFQILEKVLDRCETFSFVDRTVDFDLRPEVTASNVVSECQLMLF